MKNINCFIPFQDEAQVAQTVANLKAQELVNEIFLLHVGEGAPKSVLGCKVLEVPGLNSTAAVKAIAANATMPTTSTRRATSGSTHRSSTASSVPCATISTSAVCSSTARAPLLRPSAVWTWTTSSPVCTTCA